MIAFRENVVVARKKFHWLCLLVLCSFVVISSELDSPKPNESNSIKIVELSPGSFHSMGVEYGTIMSSDMKSVLDIVHDYYVKEHSVKYEDIVQVATYLYYKFPRKIQEMIIGISEGSKIPFNDCVVLSAIQFISPYFVPDDFVQCSFVSVDKSRTKSGYPLIGRFFDLFRPFEKVVKYLTVVRFPKLDEDQLEFVSVGFPGEIQCLTCVNSLGIFFEGFYSISFFKILFLVNNGGASGGKDVYWDREFMPARFLEIVQGSVDVLQMFYQLNSIRPDFSWITNFLDVPNKEVFSIEFSSKQDTLKASIIKDSPFVITNYFVNSTWKDIPKPTDEKTWHGVTRRENLLDLVEKSLPSEDVTIELFQKDVMDIEMSKGGALWNETVYQAVYDPSTTILYLRAPHIDMSWTEVKF